MLYQLFSLGASAKRGFGLDVMRAAAILIVVDAHATIALGQYYDGAFWHFLLPDGVELFFVLSGFLIGGILIRTYEKNGRFDRGLLLNFWTRRWFRTLPNYYLVLGGLVLLALLRAWRSGMHHTLPPALTLAKYALFLQNFATYIPDFFSETWSLAIEEWSYITLPLVLLILHAALGNYWSHRRIVLAMILTIILGTNLMRIVIALQTPISAGELGFRGIVLTRLDAISYGVLAAYVKQYVPVMWANARLNRQLLIAGLVLTGLVAFSSSIFIIGYYYEWGLTPAYVLYKRTLYFPAIGLSMALLMPYMDNWRTATGLWARFGIARAITHVSLISYSMYLLNLTPIMVNGLERIPTTSLAAGWAKVIVFWVLVLVSSTLLFKFFERPVTALRERLSSKEPTQLTNERIMTVRRSGDRMSE
ncbi:MAG: acyltransferase [Spirosoma sp.]|nr:acyltransferase [Spirosoma sp.]